MSAYRLEAHSIARVTPICCACATHGAIMAQNRSAACSHAERTATPGEHVNGARPNLGRGVDHGGQRFPRKLRFAAESTAAEDVGHRLHAIGVALQKVWKHRIEQLIVQDAQP